MKKLILLSALLISALAPTQSFASEDETVCTYAALSYVSLLNRGPDMQDKPAEFWSKLTRSHLVLLEAAREVGCDADQFEDAYTCVFSVHRPHWAGWNKDHDRYSELRETYRSGVGQCIEENIDYLDGWTEWYENFQG